MLAVLILCSVFAFVPTAETSAYLFIDGENVTRLVNTAVIYRGISSTGQNQWGQNAVADASGKIIAVYEGGNAEGADIAVPEGGAVISAAGTKAQWLRENLKIGKYVFYDPYTSRLFVCSAEGVFEPYGSFSAEVSGEDGNYRLVSAEESGNAVYGYTVAINADGVVAKRGYGIETPEGYSSVTAYEESTIRDLIMNAPVGAYASVSGGKVTFTFEKAMLKRALTLSVGEAEEKLAAAKAGFYYGDYAYAEALTEEAKALAETDAGYGKTLEMMYRLEGIETSLADRNVFELRSAFYTPIETGDAEVALTVNAAKAAGLNGIVLKLTNGYGSFLPLPEGFRFSQDEKFGGFDVLRSYIDACEKAGIGLEVCLDVFYNEYAAAAEPAWLTKPNGDESGLSAQFFSPASAEFNEYIIGYVDYLIRNYEIKGLVLDWARYPRFSENCDLGYDAETLSRFAKEYSLDENAVYDIGTRLFSHPNWSDWVEFRTGLVTDTVEKISEEVRELRPDMHLTAVAERDNVPYYYMQEATSWLENGTVDGAVLAVFSRAGEDANTISPAAYAAGIISDKSELISAYAGSSGYFFTGIESGAMISAGTIEKEVIESRTNGSDGIVFSDMRAFIDQHYAEALGKSLFDRSAVSPYGDPREVTHTLLEYSKNKINGIVTELGGCDEDTAASAFAAINGAMAKAAEDGISSDGARDLESEIAMIFARSEAKAAVLKEFAALKKYALALKSEKSNVPDDVSDNTSEDIDEPSEESGDNSEAEISEPAEPSKYETGDETPKTASVLVFAFVGIAFAAAAAAIVIGVTRRRKAADRTGFYKNRN